MHHFILLARINKLGNNRLEGSEFLFFHQRALAQDFPLFIRNTHESLDNQRVERVDDRKNPRADVNFLAA